MSRTDRVIGIVLGLVIGVVAVILFVFLGGASSIDAPSLDTPPGGIERQAGGGDTGSTTAPGGAG